MNKYKVGLHGELISERSLSILLEQGLNLEAAKKRAGSVTTAPTTSTAKTASTGEKSEKEKFKDILYRGNMRALEYVIYDTAITPLIYMWWTNSNTKNSNNWSSTAETKKYFPNLDQTGLNPLNKFKSYLYWYDPTLKEIFGSKKIRENIDDQAGWYYDNVWLGMIKALDKLTYYQRYKDSSAMKSIFENAKGAIQQLMADLHDSPSNYKIEIPCVFRLMRHPDEYSVYIQQAKAVKSELKYPDLNTQTVVEQLQALKTSLVGVSALDGDEWNQKLSTPRYTAKISYNGKEIDTFPLSPT